MEGYSRRTSATIQFLGYAITLIALVIQNIVMVPVYLRFLGKEQYGIWLTVASITGLLGVLDFDITTLLAQKTAFYYGRKDIDRLNSFVSTGILILAVIIIIVFLLGLLIAPSLAQWLSPPTYLISTQVVFV